MPSGSVTDVHGRTALMTGGCQCGAVRYAVYAEPERSGVCHCRMCQRAVGNPFHAYTGVAKTDFEWTGAQPSKFRSSDDAERSFCGTCGTPLTFQTITGDRVAFGIATLDDPSRVTPEVAIGIESKVPWADTLAGLPGKTTQQHAGKAYVDGIRSRQGPIPE